MTTTTMTMMIMIMMMMMMMMMVMMMMMMMMITIIMSFIGKIISEYINIIAGTAQAIAYMHSCQQASYKYCNRFIEQMLSPPTMPKFLFMAKFVIFLSAPLNASKLRLTQGRETCWASCICTQIYLHSRQTNNHRQLDYVGT